MQLHQLKRRHRRARKKVVGRGGKRGTTAGRGTKGQKARAGHRIRPATRDLIKKLPKRRGVRLSSRRPAAQIVKLAVLANHFRATETVSPARLARLGLIRDARRPVKILGAGPLNVKLKIENCALSAAARRAVESA